MHINDALPWREMPSHLAFRVVRPVIMRQHKLFNNTSEIVYVATSCVYRVYLEEKLQIDFGVNIYIYIYHDLLF